jgi:hypothetical protein|nr:MAG TPA: hypothetical protein [Caudoviricetes sp.]
MSTNTPNTIDLYLMENRSIMAKVNGYPIGNQNGYLIIAGEENATQFKIASIPDIYSGYTLSVEMVNSRGAGIEEKEIEDNTFVLPEGMAVAGYGQIQIYAKKTVSGREIKVPFNLIRVKVSNTISTWEESISPGAVESAKKSAAEAKSYAESAKKDSESAATAASVAESSKEAAESAAQEATQSAQSAAESASTAQNAAEEAVNTLEGKADLAGNNDFTGENTFEEAIQAKKGTVVKNSLDETNYNAGYISRNDWTYLFPADSGTFALTKNIPTDYATQTALANTQRQVDGLYTLLEQKNEIYVQTATDTYTTRETAGGENIADGVQTPVKKITGKTVKTTNLMPYPYYNPSPTVKNGITFTVNEDYSVTANGTATADANYILVINSNPILLDNSKAYTLSGCPSGGGDSTYRIYIQDTSFSETYIDRGDGMTFTPKNTEFYVYITISNGVTINNLVFKPMLNEGSTALSYMPYFPGLKNAFFKEIVSTGRNLFSAETAIPYNNCTYENGVVKQISADSADYYTWKIQFFKDSTFLTQSDVLFSQTGTIPALTIEKPSEANRLFLGLNGRERDTLMMIDVSNFPNGKYTATWNVLNITQGSVSWNNIMLNYGSSALPYEPYTQSVLSLPEAVELTEYDTAYPETGEIQRQSNTLTFNGTETWYTSIINNCYAYYVITKPVGFSTNGLISNKITTRAYTATSGQNEGCYMSNANFNAIVFWFLQTAYPNLSISAAWKAQLAAWNEAGNPLTVTYKTAEITTEQADFSADSYIAWKNGSETIEQGDTDNSEYGAENTVEQDYYLLTAPEEVTKE